MNTDWHFLQPHKKSVYHLIPKVGGLWHWLFIAALLIPAADIYAAPDPALIKRGEYIFRAAGCGGCHTDIDNGGKFLAGGRALSTPFGTFYTPNISSHPTAGIGRWTLADFIRSIRKGISPDGRHYYPVFPYPSFTNMRSDDLAALYAYLQSTPPVARINRHHDLRWYVNFRVANWFWKLLFLKTGPLTPDPKRSALWNRGAYLVIAMAHCGECHTQRNKLGVLDKQMELAGTPDGPDHETIPNITRDKATGIGDWKRSELVEYLGVGEIEDGPYADGLMAEVVENSLSYLSAKDIDAIAEYIWSVPVRRNDALADR